jgi:hypothetical protein
LRTERDRRNLHCGLVRLELQLAVHELRAFDAVREQQRAGTLLVGGAQPVAPTRALQQLVEAALVDDLSLADDRDAVAELLDLRQHVAREEDRDPFGSETLHERPHVAHPCWVEPCRRLVQEQQLGGAQQ